MCVSVCLYVSARVSVCVYKAALGATIATSSARLSIVSTVKWEMTFCVIQEHINMLYGMLINC